MARRAGIGVRGLLHAKSLRQAQDNHERESEKELPLEVDVNSPSYPDHHQGEANCPEDLSDRIARPPVQSSPPPLPQEPEEERDKYDAHDATGKKGLRKE